MVTYGGMSRKPVSLATSHLIFKQIQLHGFWMGQWNEIQGRSEARMEMYREVGDLIAQVSDKVDTMRDLASFQMFRDPCCPPSVN